MLNQKRSSRIDAKQKKLLAMLEEETVIDDPNAKAILVGYKKREVSEQFTSAANKSAYVYLEDTVVCGHYFSKLAICPVFARSCTCIS